MNYIIYRLNENYHMKQFPERGDSNLSLSVLYSSFASLGEIEGVITKNKIQNNPTNNIICGEGVSFTDALNLSKLLKIPMDQIRIENLEIKTQDYYLKEKVKLGELIQKALKYHEIAI